MATTADGMTVALEVGSADMKNRVLQTNGNTLVQDVFADVDLTIISLDAGFSVVAEIESRTSPHQIRFDTSIPNGALLELADDGSIDAIGQDGLPIGTFEIPWAKDASGNSVETFYELDGNTIVQTIVPEDGTQYPITADPTWRWGWVSGTIYFNRSETYHICHQPLNAVAILMTLISALIKRIPRLGRIIAGIPGGIGFVASVVDAVICRLVLDNVRLCLKIKLGLFGVSAGTHSGRYCT